MRFLTAMTPIRGDQRNEIVRRYARTAQPLQENEGLNTGVSRQGWRGRRPESNIRDSGICPATYY